MSEVINVNTNLFEKYTDAETLKKIIKYPNFVTAWERSVQQYASLTAIGDNGNEYTYAQLDEDTAYLRATLLKNGVKKGDKVCLYAPSSYAFVKAFLAIVTLGAVAVLVPAQLDDKTLFGCTMKFGSKYVVYEASLKEKTAIAASQGVCVIDADAAQTEKAAAVEGLTEKDPCCIVFTGGTTGKSKGALLSHGAVMAGIRNGCLGFKEIFNERYFLLIPLTHVFGLIRNLLTSLYTGSMLYICRNPKNMFKEMPVVKPTFLVIVPALAELILTIAKQMGVGVTGGCLKYIVCGASAVSPHLVTEFNELGVCLLGGYGLTESANLVCGNAESLRKPESVGLPYPNQQLKIVNGELWLKGENMMDGYVGEKEENELAYEDGWFKTGDLVRVDEEGYFYIVGRIKEVLVLDTGEKVSPQELEAKFCVLDYLSDAMVYEDFTENGRQILTLEVVPRVGCTVDVETIKADLKAINLKLLPYERVSKIVVRDKDFDRTPAMKKIRIKKSK